MTDRDVARDLRLTNLVVDDVLVARKRLVATTAEAGLVKADVLQGDIIRYGEFDPPLPQIGDILVDGSNPDADFKTIQEGIDAAAELSPTFENIVTVFVKEGIYEGFDLNVPFVAVVGFGGAGPINASVRVISPVTMSAGLSIIDNLFIKTDTSPALAVTVPTGSTFPAGLVQNTLVQCFAASGPCVSMATGTVVPLLLINCLIQASGRAAGGIGIHRTTGGGITLNQTTVGGNTILGPSPLGLLVDNDETVEVLLSKVSGIEATVALGTQTDGTDNLQIKNSEITGGTGTASPCLLFVSGSATIIGSIITDFNTSPNYLSSTGVFTLNFATSAFQVGSKTAVMAPATTSALTLLT